MLGVDLSPEDLAKAGRRLDRDDDGKLSFEEFIAWWKEGTKGPGGKGALSRLSFHGALGLERKELDSAQQSYLYWQLFGDIALCVFLLAGVVYLTLGILEMASVDIGHAGVQGECANCTFARPVQIILFPEPGCVSHTTYHIYTTLVVLIVVPAGFIASILWPLWLLSLQLGAVFAADGIGDLMEELKPVNVPRWVKESEAARARGDSSEENMLWQSEVSLPAAMLVETMFELSGWGNSMGAAIVGCWGFSLGMLPTALYSDWHAVGIASLVAVALLPLWVARQPAFVSTSCDR